VGTAITFVGWSENATLLASKGSKSGHQAKTIPNLCSQNPVVWS